MGNRSDVTRPERVSAQAHGASRCLLRLASRSAIRRTASHPLYGAAFAKAADQGSARDGSNLHSLSASFVRLRRIPPVTRVPSKPSAEATRERPPGLTGRGAVARHAAIAVSTRNTPRAASACVSVSPHSLCTLNITSVRAPALVASPWGVDLEPATPARAGLRARARRPRNSSGIGAGTGLLGAGGFDIPGTWAPTGCGLLAAVA